MDECGNCLTTEDPTRDACVGCDNVAHSGKEFNSCGVCAVKNDSNFEDYGKDCRGVCTSGTSNTYYLDDCDQCLLPSDSSWNSCLDCNGDPNGGKRTNDCGYCLDPDDDNFASYGKDCKGMYIPSFFCFSSPSRAEIIAAKVIINYNIFKTK